MKKRNKSKNKSWRTIVKEGGLIVFSVLLALFINRYAEDAKINKQKEMARRRVFQEASRNVVNIKKVKEKHVEILNKLGDILAGKNDSLRYALLEKKYFDFGLLMGDGSLWPVGTLSSTSWETAKATGIISHFDYEEVESLSDYYMVVEYLATRDLDDLSKSLFVKFNDETELDNAILGLKLQFQETISREETLAGYTFQ